MISAAKRLDDVTTYYFARKLAEIDSMNKDGGKQVLNLGIGSPDLMPPQIVIDTLCQALSLPDAHKYQSYKGIPNLRKAFSGWYKNHFDVEVNPETQILPLIGSKEGVMHASMSFINPGDQVLVPDPGYPSYSMCTRLAGGIPIPMSLEEKLGWKPDLSKLRERDLSKVKLMWINYPNMPTGAKADVRFFTELVAFAKEYNILICHDNPYTFILNDHPLSIFNVSGAEECAIELVSLSKCYNMAGWRVGAFIGSKPYIDTIMTFKSNMDSGMFKPVQEAAAVALSLGKEWIEDLNEKYLERKEAACEIMLELDLEFDTDGAGLFVWGKIKENNLDSETLTNQILYDSRVFITPGHIFGANGDKYLRISLCSSKDDIKLALQRIRQGLITDNVENSHLNTNI
jgi:aspartate/methionine/tyrosine aminotransferase